MCSAATLPQVGNSRGGGLKSCCIKAGPWYSVYMTDDRLGQFQIVKTRPKRKHANARASECAKPMRAVSRASHNEREASAADKHPCVFACRKTERAHIRQGQKGYINTLYDYVSALISVPFPGEERGFCCSAAMMTPLWLLPPNTLYQFRRLSPALVVQGIVWFCLANAGSAFVSMH